jgi:hypothetical protein
LRAFGNPGSPDPPDAKSAISKYPPECASFYLTAVDGPDFWGMTGRHCTVAASFIFAGFVPESSAGFTTTGKKPVRFDRRSVGATGIRERFMANLFSAYCFLQFSNVAVPGSVPWQTPDVDLFLHWIKEKSEAFTYPGMLGEWISV